MSIFEAIKWQKKVILVETIQKKPSIFFLKGFLIVLNVYNTGKT